MHESLDHNQHDIESDYTRLQLATQCGWSPLLRGVTPPLSPVEQTRK